MRKIVSFFGDKSPLFNDLNERASDYAASLGMKYLWAPQTPFDQADVIKHLQNADCGIIDVEPYGTPIFREIAAAHPLLIRFGVGFDKVDLKAASSFGIAVARTTGANANAVAEMAVALVFAARRELRLNRVQCIDTGKWAKNIANETIGGTIGILGLGNIGRITARYFKKLGCEVIAYDPYPNTALAGELGVELVELDELLCRSDAISVHVPYSPETHHLINAERLAMMKPTAVIVNTARGGIIDEDALYDVLKTHQIRGAALDVFSQEPVPADSKLCELDNLILTPHVSSQTYESLWNIYKMAIDIAADYFAGKDSPHILNPDYKHFRAQTQQT